MRSIKTLVGFAVIVIVASDSGCRSHDTPLVQGTRGAEAGPAAWNPAEMLARLDRAFATEFIDNDATVRLKGDLTAALPTGSRIVAFECRTGMCRVETTNTDLRTYDQFLREVFRSPSSEYSKSAVFSRRLNETASPGDPVAMVAYVARNGHELPPRL